MDYLKINFEELRQGPMKNTLDAVERAFQQFGVDFYLIGAFARDIWLSHLNYLPDRRATLDIDFSIYIKDQAQFDALKTHLVTNESFSLDEEPYRLYAPDGQIVDLIPFGGIQRDDEVYLNGNPPAVLSVFGNQQVLSHAQAVESGDSVFKICTLPGLCVLKLVAGFERPERRPKDFGDFYYILENYFEIAADKLFEGDFDDLIEGDFEPAIAAAKMLAKQLFAIIKMKVDLKRQIEEILNFLKEKFSDDEIDQMFGMNKKDKKIARLKLISIMTKELKSLQAV